MGEISLAVKASADEGSFLKPHTLCVVYITYLDDTLVGHSKE